MSAMNLFVGKRSVLVVTDRAGCTADGVLQDTRRKVSASSDLRMAIAKTGLRAADDDEIVQQWLESHQDQSTALRDLPNLLRELVKAKEVALCVPGTRERLTGVPDVITLAIGIWSAERQQPEGYVMTSDLGHLPDRVPPFRLCPAKEYVQPPVDCSFYPSPDQPAHADCLALLETQRAIPAPWGGLNVGGGADMAIVDADGAWIETLYEWPDVIGLKIGQALPPRGVLARVWRRWRMPSRQGRE